MNTIKFHFDKDFEDYMKQTLFENYITQRSIGGLGIDYELFLMTKKVSESFGDRVMKQVNELPIKKPSKEQLLKQRYGQFERWLSERNETRRNT